MKRVAVTGIGAVTPLGLDVPSTWRAAQAGRERDRLDLDVRHRRPAGARRRRGEGIRPDAGRVAEGGAEARAERAARRRGRARGAGRRGAERIRPVTRRDHLRLGDRRRAGHPRAGRHAARARARPRLAELPAERPRRLGVGPARDLARDHRPELRGRLGVRDRLARRRRGGRDDQARRRRRGARRRHRVVHHPADPRRLHRDARTRRRGRAPAARVAAVRRDARRLRDVGGRRRAAARGLGSRRGARRRHLRRGARLRRVERRDTTWRSPSPRRPASPR